MKISVIVVNFNGKNYLEACLNSVLKTDFKGFEIVVVENGSNDGSWQLLTKKYKHNQQIKLIKSSENLFFTGGCNLGAKKAWGDWLVFLNPDTVVDKNWFKEMWLLAKTDKKLCLQPKIKIWQTNKIDCVIGKYVWPGFGRAVGRGKPDNYQGIIWGDYANGTCLMINKKWFFDLGGFDDNFRYFYEDVDLQLRAKKQGGRAAGVMSAVIEHKGSLSFKQNMAAKTVKKFYRRNRLLTIMKNYSGWFNRQRIREMKRFIKQKEFSWLDLGCGEGELVRLLKEQGIEAIGIDEKMGKKIEKFTTRKRFAVISMYHVLEHAQSPELVLEKIKKWLKPGGLLVVEVPLVGNLTEKWLKQKYMIYFDKTHRHFWHKQELKKLLNDSGYKIISKGSTWQQFPFQVVRVKGLLGLLFWPLLKLLSIIGFNDEIIRLYCSKKNPLIGR